MSSFRFLWSKILRFKASYTAIPVRTYSKGLLKNYQYFVPYTVGFSIFTWLGFDEKKTSPEDELINTIKHCVLFIQRTEYEKAEQLLHIALRQAQQLHHKLGITYVYDVMANLALEREQLNKAKDLFIAVSQRIMGDGATEDDLRVVHISIKLARISHLKKEYTTAQLGYDWCLEKLNKELSIDPSADVKKLIALTEDWYGRLFLDCDEKERGLNLMLSSLNKMKELNIEQEHIVIQLNDIGTICDKMGKYDESISYLTEAIDLGKKLELDDVAAIYINLGRAYLKKSLVDEARKYCGHGWKMAVMSKDKAVKDEAEMCFKEIKNFK